jgi:hypothetical protein
MVRGNEGRALRDITGIGGAMEVMEKLRSPIRGAHRND